MKDYYRILGVSSDAEKATIRGAYRELASKYYKTEESGGAPDNHYLADLAEAYEVLVDDKKRSEYDRMYFGGSSETGEEVDHFRSLFQQKSATSEQQLVELFSRCSGLLTEAERTAFDAWRSRAFQLWTLIHAAKSSDWSTDIEQAEPFLDALPQLGPAAKEDYEKWAKRNADRDKYKLEQKINQLHAEIKGSGPWARFKNRVQWKRRASQLRADFKDRFPGDHDRALDYINSNHWIPPFIPVSIGLVVVALIGVFIWNPFDLKWTGTDDVNKPNADTILTDADGMNEQLLKDFIATAQKYNYDWATTFSKFPELKGYDQQLLKDYVATAEKYNYDYAVVNSYFPEFGFAQKKEEGLPVQSQAQGQPTQGRVPADGGDEPQPTTNARFITVPDLDGDNDIESYKVPEAVVSDSGILYNYDRWRCKNGKWQKLPKGSANWGNDIKQEDLGFLCKKLNWKPIQKKSTGPEPGVNTEPTSPAIEKTEDIRSLESEIEDLWDVCGQNLNNYCSNRNGDRDKKINECYTKAVANRSKVDGLHHIQINKLYYFKISGCSK